MDYLTLELRLDLLGLKVHWVKGSPLYPGIQTHIGVWLTTLHSVFEPQEPGHGFRHFLFMQASWVSHSLLLTHSGLQFGGDPENSGKHVQEGKLLTTSHRALGPHGDNSHGLVGDTVGVAIREIKYFTLKVYFTSDNRLNGKIYWVLVWSMGTYVEGSMRQTDHLWALLDKYKLDYD